MEKTLPLLLALLLAGCSTRVEVSTERTAPGDPLAVERLHTGVAVDLLTDREEAPTPSPEPEQPPAPATTEKGVEVAGVANFAIVVEGDLHIHQHHDEHFHFENRPAEKRPAPKRNRKTSEPVESEVRGPRIDPRCERLLREHEQRVEAWKKMMNR